MQGQSQAQLGCMMSWAIGVTSPAASSTDHKAMATAVGKPQPWQESNRPGIAEITFPYDLQNRLDHP